MYQFDISPDEVESREELALHVRAGTLRGLTVQGVHLDGDPPDWSALDVMDTLFVGCRFDSVDTCADLIRRGAHIIGAFGDIPYPIQPARLYTADDLSAGFAEHGFAGMYDSVVYKHFVAQGGALPPIREALTQRLHDHGIDDGLADTIDEWAANDGGPVVGIMGGHAAPRGSASYRAAAAIGHELARAGVLVVTGGGPGVMEAANLGAFLSAGEPDVLDAAINALSEAPDFHDQDPYTGLALRVRAAFTQSPPTESASGASRPERPEPLAWARRGGLSIPTWLYGHEPANLFAARIAKYFSNAIREETILRLSRGGIVFTPGMAGTVQEVFQAATMAFYRTNGPSGPFIFIGSAHWSGLPVVPLLRTLLATSPYGDMSHLVIVTDSVEEAVAALTGRGAGGE